MTKYKDKDWLYEKYWEESMEQSEIADMCGVDDSTISRWMNNLSVPTEFHEHVERSELEKMYKDDKMSTRDIADKFGVDKETVRTALYRNGVIPRERLEYQKYRPAQYSVSRGYPVSRDQSNGTCNEIKIHRLVAVAEYGIDKVIGMDVHHKNGVKWDNRPENLTLMTPKEHMRMHAKEREMWKKSPR